MGYLDKGNWVDQWYDTKKFQGEFRREKSQFRSIISNSHDVLSQKPIVIIYMLVTHAPGRTEH